MNIPDKKALDEAAQRIGVSALHPSCERIAPLFTERESRTVEDALQTLSALYDKIGQSGVERILNSTTQEHIAKMAHAGE